MASDNPEREQAELEKSPGVDFNQMSSSTGKIAAMEVGTPVGEKISITS
jgi:hypothetical protein